MVKKEAPERAAKFGKMSREKGGSMKKERKQYGNEFKAKVVLEVIKGAEDVGGDIKPLQGASEPDYEMEEESH